MHDITATELAARIARGDDLVLLDVREEEEIALSRIEGSTFIPLWELEERAGELAPMRDRDIIALCHTGLRSTQATEVLADCGYHRVRSLRGGLEAYAEVDPKVARY